jgi:guanylate kinase
MGSGTERCGRLIVISAPSGAGKTTIARAILERNPSLEFSVSATTRPRRATEVEGKDYFFLTREEFLRAVEAGEFVEWEEIYGNYYGTLKREVDRALGSGRHIVFDIDVKGGLAIKKQYPEALLIFIRPPSIDALRERLKNRRTEDEATFARRLERVPMELAMGDAFDVQIVNDDLDKAIEEVQECVVHHIHSL